jgi:RimJ/RimL family protein N-acetyltransferase
MAPGPGHRDNGPCHLAFAGLDATDAVSEAFDDNVSSLRVSEKLGYEPGARHSHRAGAVPADVRAGR